MKLSKFNAQCFELRQQDVSAGRCFVYEADDVRMHELRVLSIEGRKLEELRRTDRPRVFMNSDVQGSADLRDNRHDRWTNSWWRLATSLS
jgi:hypothetical protein